MHYKSKMKRNIRKLITISISGCLLFLLLGTIHVSQGQASSGYFNFWQQLWHDEQQQNFLLHSRLPRFVIGCLAGSALAVAGMLMQTMTKNPLASASTLGIHSGAYFFVVACAIFFPRLSGTPATTCLWRRTGRCASRMEFSWEDA